MEDKTLDQFVDPEVVPGGAHYFETEHVVALE